MLARRVLIVSERMNTRGSVSFYRFPKGERLTRGGVQGKRVDNIRLDALEDRHDPSTYECDAYVWCDPVNICARHPPYDEKSDGEHYGAGDERG